MDAAARDFPAPLEDFRSMLRVIAKAQLAPGIERHLDAVRSGAAGAAPGPPRPRPVPRRDAGRNDGLAAQDPGAAHGQRAARPAPRKARRRPRALAGGGSRGLRDAGPLAARRAARRSGRSRPPSATICGSSPRPWKTCPSLQRNALVLRYWQGLELRKIGRPPRPLPGSRGRGAAPRFGPAAPRPFPGDPGVTLPSLSAQAQERLDQLLAECMVAEDEGRVVDVERLAAASIPDLAAHLREHFDAQHDLRQAAGTPHRRAPSLRPRRDDRPLHRHRTARRWRHGHGLLGRARRSRPPRLPSKSCPTSWPNARTSCAASAAKRARWRGWNIRTSCASTISASTATPAGWRWSSSTASTCGG